MNPSPKFENYSLYLRQHKAAFRYSAKASRATHPFVFAIDCALYLDFPNLESSIHHASGTHLPCREPKAEVLPSEGAMHPSP